MQENVNVQEVKSTKEKTLFILKIVGNVLFYIVIIALLLFSIMNINAGSKNGGFPNIFGKGFLSVQTNSMERDDTSNPLPTEYADYEIGEIFAGDLVYVSVVSGDDYKDLKVGDVVTFFDSGINALNTHRIVNITMDGEEIANISVQGDLSVTYFGKYDPTNPDKAANNSSLIGRGDVQTFSGDFAEIKGVVTGVSSGSGKVIDNIQKNWLWYFVLPVLAFLLIEVYFVIKNIMDLKGAKQKAELATDKEALMAELEAQKEEMRRQILAEMAAEQAKLQQQEEKPSDDEKEE